MEVTQHDSVSEEFLSSNEQTDEVGLEPPLSIPLMPPLDDSIVPVPTTQIVAAVSNNFNCTGDSPSNPNDKKEDPKA